MYAGSGNISREVVIEHLVNIARELESIIVAINNTFDSSSLPRAEVVDKLFRQDLVMSKDRIEKSIAQLLLYIASGRIELVDSKELILRVTEGYRDIVTKLEAFIHRIKLAKRAGIEFDDKIFKRMKEMLNHIAEASGHITTLARLSGRALGNHDVARMMETRNDKVQEIERLVDDLYREVLDTLIDTANDFKKYILIRDAINMLEDTMDMLSKLSLNYFILGVGMATSAAGGGGTAYEM
ncbi:MAG: hypothetical protein F7C37_03480 [Desulfurococcales archaeon]|nr:hypothetical protein [Desulfurococcales archaeon]MCE4622918.1 hypothetical protein [Desulfurococcales archaeon]